MGGLSGAQILALQERVAAWRDRALMAGAMHPLWDCIADAEALLDGKPTIMRGMPAEVYAQLMAIR